jgi:ATP-dependent DNA helicase DinG
VSLAARIGEAFDAGGILASALDGFRPREGQRHMAEAVAAALEARDILLVEAGTGTGKTYAYLAPVLEAGLKVVVSTGTKTLQDQLFRRDLPALSGALGRPVQVALLKGRANYLCRHRLALALEEDARPTREARRLAKIREWARVTTTGEIAEVPGIPEDAPVWGRVTSNADNCLGQDCPEFQRCHVVKARREALKADVVVVNHHLLLADLALKEEGFGELLPGADAVVVDEAHQLPEIAARFFSVGAGTRQALGLAADARAEAVNAGAWQPKVEAAVTRWSAPRGRPPRCSPAAAGRAAASPGRSCRPDRRRRSPSSNRPRARSPRSTRRCRARARGSTRSSAARSGSPNDSRGSAAAARATSCAGPRPAGAAPACTPRPPTPGARWRPS